MSNMQNFLKVTAIINRADKNSRPFQQVTFNEVGYLPTGQEILTSKVRTRNLWSSTEDQKGDSLFNQLKVGSMVAGSVQTFNTTAFEINDRVVNKTTLVIFDGENPISYANSQLKRNNACVVDEHGQPTASFSQPVSKVTEEEVVFDGVESDEETF